MITCTFEDGGKAALRHVCVDALVVRGDEILLVKRATHLLEGNKYCLPGGYLDRDETTIEAVKREVLEETGYEVHNPKLFQMNDNPFRTAEDRQNISFIFLVEIGEQVGVHDHEVQEARWFNLSELPNESDIAFDHADTINLYKQYMTKRFSLPHLTSS